MENFVQVFLTLAIFHNTHAIDVTSGTCKGDTCAALPHDDEIGLLQTDLQVMKQHLDSNRHDIVKNKSQMDISVKHQQEQRAGSGPGMNLATEVTKSEVNTAGMPKASKTHIDGHMLLVHNTPVHLKDVAVHAHGKPGMGENIDAKPGAGKTKDSAGGILNSNMAISNAVGSRSDSKQSVRDLALNSAQTCTRKEYIDCFGKYQTDMNSRSELVATFFSAYPLCTKDKGSHICPNNNRPPVALPSCPCLLVNPISSILKGGRLHGRRVFFIGDSIMKQTQVHFQCFANAVGLDIQAHFKNAKTIDDFLKQGGFKWKGLDPSKDFIVFNWGLHYNWKPFFLTYQRWRSRETFETDLQTLSDHMKSLDTPRRSRMLWMETSASHFPGGTIAEDSLDLVNAQGHCENLAEKKMWEKAFWRNRMSNPVMEKAGIKIVPSFNMSFGLFTEHPTNAEGHRDCSHYCTNSPYFTSMASLILVMLDDAISGEQH